MATCLERKVAERDNWFQLLELPGVCGVPGVVVESSQQVAKGSYHLQFVRPDLDFSLWPAA